jgi:hypothetical protein
LKLIWILIVPKTPETNAARRTCGAQFHPEGDYIVADYRETMSSSSGVSAGENLFMIGAIWSLRLSGWQASLIKPFRSCSAMLQTNDTRDLHALVTDGETR